MAEQKTGTSLEVSKTEEELLLEIDELKEIVKALQDGARPVVLTGKKATQHKMNSLHDLLAEYFTDALSSGDDLSSGTLAAINTFLKNNNITSDISESNPTQNLAGMLQSLIEDK